MNESASKEAGAPSMLPIIGYHSGRVEGAQHLGHVNQPNTTDSHLDAPNRSTSPSQVEVCHRALWWTAAGCRSAMGGSTWWLK
jgi:hypothetical protein